MYKKYCSLRDAKGLRDADVSRDTGIARSTFSDWKSGRSQPKSEKLQKIADYFEVPLSYFYDDVDKAWEEHKESVEQLDIQQLLDMMCDAVVKRVMSQDFHSFDRETYKSRMKHYSDFLISEMRDGNKHND